MTNAYAALVAANYDALPELIARLDAALDENPENGRLALYAGTMRLWRATGRPLSPGEQFNDVLQAIKLLQRGHASRPGDPHLSAFLGIAQVTFGMVAGDEKRIAEGKQILEEGVPLYPAYVSGVMAQALAQLPRNHPSFAGAADAMRASFAACGYDQAAIDTLTFDYPKGPTQGSCWNGGIVAHIVEGILLIAGDIFVKQGDVESGLRMYATVKKTPTYDRWPFHEELERRIADADKRAELYGDEDPDNDPSTWVQEDQLCVGCHATQR